MDPLPNQAQDAKKYEMIHIEMKQTHFYVYREFLLESKNFQFEKTFGDISKTHFILDRDPKMFNLILEYLKSNRDKMPKNLSELESSAFQEELRFWSL